MTTPAVRSAGAHGVAPRVPVLSRGWTRGLTVGDGIFVTGLAALVGYAGWLGRDLWFFSDDWDIIAFHHAGSYLTPFNGHLVLLPVAIYHTLFVTAGLGSYTPYRIVGLAGYAALGILLFIYARQRVQPMLAAFAALSIIWFSAAQLNVMFPFLVNFSIPLAAAVAIWLLLDRDQPPADIGAAICLAVALASSAIGLVIAAAVGAELLARRASVRRWLPFGPPLILWSVWYARYHTKVATGGIGGTIRYALHEIEGTFAGFAGGWDPAGYALLVATVAAFGLAIFRWKTFNARAFGALVGFAAFVALTAYSRIGIVPAIPADTGRYIWLNAFFGVVALVEIARGRNLTPFVIVASAMIVALGAVTLVGNLQEYNRQVRLNERATRTFIVAAEAIPDHIDRTRIIRPFSYIPVRVGQYLTAVAHLGSPLGRVRAGDLGTEEERATADGWMIHDLHLRLAAVDSESASPCRPVTRPADESGFAVRGTTAVVVRAGATPARVSLRRLVRHFHVTLGQVAPGETGELSLPADRSQLPWYVQVLGSGASVSACR